MLVILGFLTVLACVLALMNKRDGKTFKKNGQLALDYSMQEELVGHMIANRYTEEQMNEILDENFSRAA